MTGPPPLSGCNHAGKMIWSNERSDGEFIKTRGEMEVAMRTTLWIAFTTILLVVGGTLAMMNNACKTSYHSWCRPTQTSGSGSSHLRRPLDGARVQPPAAS
jgi:hypothetical protein